MWQSGHWLKILWAMFFVLISASVARAGGGITVETTCPLDNQKFQIFSTFSSSVMGTRLDFKVLSSAYVTRLPVCPSSGFPMYKKDFSEDELASLRDYVRTEEYRELRSQHSNYYMAFHFFRRDGADTWTLAWVLLNASWETERKKRKIQLHRRYLALTVQWFDKFLEEHPTRDSEWWKAQVVAGDLERQLKKFDVTRQRLESLPVHEILPDSEYRLIRDQILDYAAQEISKPQVIEFPDRRKTRAGYAEAIEQALADGVNPNASNWLGDTLLVMAVELERADLIERLVQRGADVDMRGRPREQNPLETAVDAGDIQMVRVLLEHGADPLATDKMRFARSTAAYLAAKEGYSVMFALILENASPSEAELADMLNGAAGSGSIPIAAQLIDMGVPIDARGWHGFSALQVASFGHLKMVKYLVSRGATIDFRSPSGDTALLYAFRHPEVVRYLISQGADVNAANAKGETVLSVAVRNDAMEIVKQLIAADVDAAAGAPLEYAVLNYLNSKQSREKIDMLLDAGVNIDAHGRYGTALAMAVSGNKPELVEYFARRGANLDTRDFFGRSSLTAAVKQGRAEMVETLLRNGADPNFPDADGRRPLDFLEERDTPGIRELLLKYGAIED